jgi:redox-regulated HSP33 family molecular chaperone
MKSNVTYNGEGKISRIVIDADHEVGLKATFQFDGTTASMVEATTTDKADDDVVYGDSLSRIFDYANSLHFVDRVQLAEYDYIEGEEPEYANARV